METIQVSTFYKFIPLSQPRELREPIREAMRARAIKGTITLAPEGINATISGTTPALDDMMDYLQSLPPIGELASRESHFSTQPFQRSKVKVKRELISLGTPTDPTVCVGTYVAPKDWNALISAPDVITIDTRNGYEYRIGRFHGAINPDTRDFKQMVSFTKQQLDPKTHPRVAMYCTGGIRCEKYSSYLLTQGFQEVYHLQGGILHYLAAIPEAQSLWEGVCYVFDERVAVNHDLSKADHISMCRACGNPLDDADRQQASDNSCPYC